MMRFAVAVAAFAAAAAHAVVPPPPNMHVEGVPPIPESTAQALRPYGEFRPHAMLSWHPARREMLVRARLRATNQVHHVEKPGARPQPLTDFPDAVSAASYQPTHGEYFVFAMGKGGNEEYRLYRQDVAGGDPVAFSPEGQRANLGTWSRKGDRLVFTTVLVDRNNPDRVARTTVHVADPAQPAKARAIATLEGGTWTTFRFSEDGRRLVFIEYLSANHSHVWTLDIASGRKRRVTAGGGEPVAYRDPYFARDGRGLLATSDRGSEFKRLVYLPPGGGAERVLTGHIAHDVENFEVSHDGSLIAFVTNERGSSVLRFMDGKTLKELPRPPLFDGVIGGLEWRRGSSEVGFQISSARSAEDVFSYDVKANRLTRWTNGNNPEVNTSEFAEPRLVRWKSFDGLEITGFHYHPPARFAGKRPVIVNIHGGPESQARPRFIGRNNYFVGEMGIAMIYPNVRGSSGFGKTFLRLDDGRRREDAVRDIGALLDWIAQQPDLDASRVMVMGGSYGGYMALACAFHFADRIAGASSSVGISNFVTFLERTESYRRDRRRAEYGDERDPEMRAFLESISPLSHAAKITRPLLVMQGRNDPRVPYTEAEQIVATLRQRGTPVWFLMAGDEGHGFAKRPNADFAYYTLAEFARRTILAPP